MAFSDSALATYTRISPNCNIPRNQPISKVTIHHMASIMTVESFGDLVSRASREMTSNYAIGNDGRIGLYCHESNRSWCTSSEWNDHRAITIEVSNCAVGDDSGWPISNEAYTSLIRLCVDICQRNGIKKLEFDGTIYGSLTYHYQFWNTACLPVDKTELLTPTGWKLLKDITLEDKVATVHMDTLGIRFDEIEGIIPQKIQDTYIIRNLEATSDHRIMYYQQNGRQFIGQYKDLYDKKGSIYIPNAGYIENPEGLPLSDDELEFLIAVQADGSYMRDGNCLFGVEFHLQKERKIERLKALFERLDMPYNECNQSDGTTKLRIYGKQYYEFCEKYLQEKMFTWEWLNLNKHQAEFFLEVILLYDGCVANRSYSSYLKQNVDIVQAIASLNGVGTNLQDDGKRVYFLEAKRSIGECVKKRKPKQKVSCVTVRSGFILIRQHGRTTIVGNCPGPYIKSHTKDICDKVNLLLSQHPTISQLQAYTQTAGDAVDLSAYPTASEYALTGTTISVEPDYKAIKAYMTTLDRMSKKVDYEALKEAGVIGSLIEAGYVYDTSHMVMSTFVSPTLEAQVKAAKEADIPYGLFTYTRARSITEANLELKWLRIYIQKYVPPLGVWLKLELANDKDINDMIIGRYKTLLEASGLKGKMGFYVTRDQLSRISWDKWQDDFLLWLVDHVDNVSELDTLLDPTFFDL